MSNTLTTSNSPVANVSVSTSNSPADDPAWPNAGSDSSSRTQPSASNCSSTSVGLLGERGVLGDRRERVEHAGAAQQLESWITVRPGHASHDGSGPLRPMP